MPYKDPISEAAKASRSRCNKRFYASNIVEMRARVKTWRSDNPEKVKAQKRRHTKKYLAKSLARVLEWEKTNPARTREAELAHAKRPSVRLKHADYRRRTKSNFIAAYGGACACCGEARLVFLTGDHVGGRNGDTDKGHKFYARVRREGYPQDKYRALCWNCNAAIGLFGKCPHEDEKFDCISLAC